MELNANKIDVLPRGKFYQVAYKLTLLDLAVIRSNGPDEILSRNVGGGDRFIIPDSKIRHAMREFVERMQRSVDIAVTCRAQHYCSSCPSCYLFGSFGATGDNKKTWSMRSRVNMTDAVALSLGATPEMRTINSVDPATMKTGTAGLTKVFAVPAGTEFYGYLSLLNFDADALRIFLSALLSVTRVGARTAVHGLCKVEILGVKESYVEDTTWSPQVVLSTGVMPNGGEPLLKSLNDPGEEDRMIESLVRFQGGVVKRVVDKLSGPLGSVDGVAKALGEALAVAEVKGETKGLVTHLKKLASLKDVKDNESASALVASALSSLTAKGAISRDAIRGAALQVREALANLGAGEVLAEDAIEVGGEA